MGTAQRNVTTAAPSWPSGDPTTNVSNAVASFVAGGTIRASHFNYIIDSVNQMNGHNHTWTDYYQRATYGNNGDRANYEQTSTSNGPNGVSGLTGRTVGQIIYASAHNDCLTSVTALASHTHTENDRTS
jgi:hypothetical protein